MNNTGRINTITLTRASLTAALYVVLTLLSQMIGLASGPIQFRLSEVLVVLPALTWAAIPGLTVGCAISNIVTGCAFWDVVFGTLATFIGAYGTYLLSKRIKVSDGKGILHDLILSYPSVVSNMLIIPFVLTKFYGADGSYIYFVLTVGLGEAVCAGILGTLLIRSLNKTGILR